MREVRRYLGAAFGLALFLAPAGAHAFSADTLAGTWTGTWKNLRFKGVGGPFTIVITAPDADTIVVDASGADFGCGALAAPVTLHRGVEWTDAGASATFGTITLAYVETARTLAGAGTNCHGSWIARGRVKKSLKKFKGVSFTTLTDGKKAKSKIGARRP